MANKLLMDRGDRILGSFLILLYLALGLIGALMAAVGWSDMPSVLGIFWGISGVLIVVSAVGGALWIGQSVVAGTWG